MQVKCSYFFGRFLEQRQQIPQYGAAEHGNRAVGFKVKNNLIGCFAFPALYNGLLQLL